MFIVFTAISPKSKSMLVTCKFLINTCWKWNARLNHWLKCLTRHQNSGPFHISAPLFLAYWVVGCCSISKYQSHVRKKEDGGAKASEAFSYPTLFFLTLNVCPNTFHRFPLKCYLSEYIIHGKCHMISQLQGKLLVQLKFPSK